MPEYPAWICHDCGTQHGTARGRYATFHLGKCGWCGKMKSITQPRDYSYPPAPQEKPNAEA